MENMQVWERCLGDNPVVQCFFNFYSEILWIIGIRRVLLSKITEDVIVVVTL